MKKKLIRNYEIGDNEILMLPVSQLNTQLSLDAEYYRIESSNTKEAFISASTKVTRTANGNEQVNVFYVQKSSSEAEIATVVNEGVFELGTLDESEEKSEPTMMAIIYLKSYEEKNK